MTTKWIKELIKECQDKSDNLESKIDVIFEYNRLTNETKEEYDLLKKYYGNSSLLKKMTQGYYICYIFNPIEKMIMENKK